MPYKTDERVAELTERLENGIKEVYASGSYEQYITSMAKFHQYSYRNALLILLQCPHASQVAGYGTWGQLGRQVKKGEKGIQILAPCNFQRVVERDKIDPKTGRTLYGPDGKPLTEKEYAAPNRFRIAHVFDLSQTEGRELSPITPPPLTGDVADYTGIYNRLTAISPLPVVQEDFPQNAYGYTSFTENKTVVKPGLSQVQTIKTLVHEIAHGKRHQPEDLLMEQTPAQKRQKEIEAESIAYVVCQHFGIDTSDYSFSYIAQWGKDEELTVLKASLDAIHTTAREIIDAISPPPPKLERTQEQAQHPRQSGTRRTQKARR